MATAKQTARLFWHHASKYPLYVVGLGITIPLSVLIGQFLPPLIVAEILSRLSHGEFIADGQLGGMLPQLLLFTGLSILSGLILWRINIVLLWNLEMRVLRDMAQRIFNHLMHQSSNFHANRFGGSLVSQTNKLIGSYVRFADVTLFDVLTMITAYAFTIIILLPKAPLFVGILLAITAIYMVVAVFLSKPVQKATAFKASLENKQTGNIADSITNVMAVKSFAAEHHERDRFAGVTEEVRSATRKQMVTEIFRDTYSATFTAGIEVIALFVAVFSVVALHADIGLVFLLVAYTNNISRRMWDFSTHVLRNYSRAFGDASEMVDILSSDSELKDPIEPEKLRIKDGAINFKDMTFNHVDANDILFEKLNLDIKPGEKIGLVGHSGSGKTTLTKVLLRYADIKDGEVLIDGQNIANITQADLRGSIAYVPQEPLLFHRSIRENIAYGKPDASDDEIFLAAKRANASEFIEKLPKGYETLVGERGVKLSGGQRQRVAIARAMLKDAPILMLDEATSALDSESEKLIQSALWELMKDRTAIVIAHRLSTVQRMDRIVVLEDGKIVEQGTHKELLDNDEGTYASLWRHQSGGFIED